MLDLAGATFRAGISTPRRGCAYRSLTADAAGTGTTLRGARIAPIPARSWLEVILIYLLNRWYMVVNGTHSRRLPTIFEYMQKSVTRIHDSLGSAQLSLP